MGVICEALLRCEWHFSATKQTNSVFMRVQVVVSSDCDSKISEDRIMHYKLKVLP